VNAEGAFIMKITVAIVSLLYCFIVEIAGYAGRVIFV